MIRVALTYANGRLVGIHSQGHAPRSGLASLFGGRENPLCTALSTIEYNLIYSLKALTHAELESRVAKGDFFLKLKDYRKEEEAAVNALMASYAVGLEMLKGQFQGKIEIILNQQN